jgi:hypothetical protein
MGDKHEKYRRTDVANTKRKKKTKKTNSHGPQNTTQKTKD